MSNNIYALAIPKWGIEMEKGTITHWHSDVGDTVNKGDELVDIESDKIVNTLEATASGVLRRKLVDEDDTLAVGELIGVIADADSTDADIDAFIDEFNAAFKQSEEPEKSTPATPPPAVAPIIAPTQNTPGKVRISPPVKRKAKQLGVDIDTVVGTGAGGRITSDDVERAANNPQSSSSVNSPDNDKNDEFTSTTLSSTQQTVGRRLTQSKQTVPHFYLSVEIELDGLLSKRDTINKTQSKRVSINDMIVWCTAHALQEVPEINAQLINDELRQFKHADISVAVSTKRGLLTPVVKAADQMTPTEVASTISQLVEKANTGTLQRDDIDGGSFTVSNLGMYGVNRFEAIINPPQVAILALGKAKQRVVVKENGETGVATVLNASLSCDHRVVDGALGGTFLSALQRQIESLS